MIRIVFQMMTAVTVMVLTQFAAFAQEGGRARYEVATARGVVTVEYIRSETADGAAVVFRLNWPDGAREVVGELGRPRMRVDAGEQTILLVRGGMNIPSPVIVAGGYSFTSDEAMREPEVALAPEMSRAREALIEDASVLLALEEHNGDARYFRAPYQLVTRDWRGDLLQGVTVIKAPDPVRSVELTFGGCLWNCEFWNTSCSQEEKACVLGCEVQYGQRAVDHRAKCGSLTTRTSEN